MSPRRQLRRLRGCWRRYVAPEAVAARRGTFGLGRVVQVLPGGHLHLDVWTWPAGWGRADADASLTTEDATLRVGRFDEGVPVAVYTWRETDGEGALLWRVAVVSLWRPLTVDERAELRVLAEGFR